MTAIVRSVVGILQREPPLWVRIMVLLVFCSSVTYFGGLHPDVFSMSMGMAALLLLLLFAGSMGVRGYSIFIGFLILLLGGYFLTLVLYGPLSFDLVLAARYTTFDESMGYAKDLFRPAMVLSWLFGAVLVYLVLWRSRVVVAGRYAVPAIGLLLLALPTLRSVIANMDWTDRYKDKSIVFSSVPSKLVATLFHQFSMVNELADWSSSFEAGHDWSGFRDLHLERLNVIVIGESGRADFYDVNGFPLFPLTPCIDSTFSYNFTQCISPASTTISSLMRTLFLTDTMGAPIPQANIVALFKAHGAKTYWVSNQGRVGKNDSPIASLGLTCDSAYFLNKTSYHSATAGDKAMLPWLEGVIGEVSNREEPALIVVHLLAQHPPIDRDYDAVDIPFQGPEMVMKYMRSTRDTDDFLGELLSMVRKAGGHNMIYFSDHGLGYDARGDHFIHTDKYWENYHVPLVIWTDSQRQGRSVARSVSLMDLIPIVHLLNRKDRDLVGQLDVLSPPSVVFDSNNRPKAVSELVPNAMVFPHEE